MKIAMVVLLAASSVHAQPSAATVLQNVETFYANTPHLRAAFEQTVTSKTFNATKVSSGNVYMLKPTNVRFDYMAKRAGEVVLLKSFASDATTLSIVDNDQKQLTQGQVSANAFPSFAFFTNRNLAAQFSVALTTSSGALVLELTPKQPSTQYKQRWIVDPTSWAVTESIAIAPNGDMNDFKLASLDVKSAVSAKSFVVSASALPSYKLVKSQPPPSSGPTP